MSYKHLSIQECERLMFYRAQGLSICKIALFLERNKSTIARELKRNDKDYSPSKVQARYKRRRKNFVRAKSLTIPTCSISGRFTPACSTRPNRNVRQVSYVFNRGKSGCVDFGRQEKSVFAVLQVEQTRQQGSQISFDKTLARATALFGNVRSRQRISIARQREHQPLGIFSERL